jgi:ankyrin repeat protein
MDAASSKWHEDVQILEILVQHAAEINAQNVNRCHALCSAGKAGNVPGVVFLLKHGALVNNRNVLGSTPLNSAVDKNMVGVVRALLEHGADPNIDFRGITPLELAKMSKFQEIVDLLVEQQNAQSPDNSKEAKPPSQATSVHR